MIPIQGTMQQFNRYGLPGLVIGALLLIIIGLIYVLFNIAVPAIQANTRAMVEITNAVSHLTEIIKDRK